MKTTHWVPGLVLFTAFFSGIGVRAEIDGHSILNLDGVWKFFPAFEELQYNHAFLQENTSDQKTCSKDDRDRNYGWIDTDFNDDAWWDINVPSSWNRSFSDLWSYEGYGWYRKTVFIPEFWTNKRILFTSDGANYRTVLYVNGNRAGVHEGGYLRFSFPIHEFLRFGEENTLAVSVDNLSLPERCPGERHDWWNHGGLYRSVRLEVTEKVYIDHTIIVTDATADPPTVRIQSVIRSELGPEDPVPPDLVLRTNLYAPGGGFNAEHVTPLRFEADVASVTSTFRVQDALLWSPDSPNLYRVALKIHKKNSNRQIDRWAARVGIRSIEIKGEQLLLNGKPFLIQGVNRYEDYADTGMTPNDAALRRDIYLMKKMGVNTVRCHYPHSPGTYDLYDEAGLLTICEVPLYQWGRPGHSTRNLDAAKIQLTEMIETLCNHPSVMMWSVSNENRIRPKEESEEHRRLSGMVCAGNIELIERAHGLDPTRPAIEVSNCWPNDPVFDVADLNAVNVYIGGGAPVVDSLPDMMNKMHEKMETLREMHPGKPILVTEFGSWGLYGLKTDYYPGEIYQTELLRQFWENFLEESGFVGGLIWCFADSDVHRQYSTIYELRCAYGVFDLHRRPKAAVEVMRSLWTRK